jgi:hypothetical protein
MWLRIEGRCFNPTRVPMDYQLPSIRPPNNIPKAESVVEEKGCRLVGIIVERVGMD